MLANHFENQRFGRLTAIKKSGRKTKYNNSFWLCKCACGKEIEVCGGNLKSGHATSCGCAKDIANKRLRLIHGMTKTRPHGIWCQLRGRCLNPKNEAYKNYGGRGITVCDRWKESFINFWEDMKEGYADNLSIDRIDNDKGYCKENCHWTTFLEQARNKRNNRWLTFNGETKTLAEWARFKGWHQAFLSNRINRDGRSIEWALTTPKLR